MPREAVSIVSWSAWSVGRVTLEGESNSYNYYQGRIDTLAWILKQLPTESGIVRK